MKIRQGFVSNSSSSSFVIDKSLLTKEQLSALKAYCSTAVGPYQDTWDIYENKYTVEGYCTMNNNCEEIGGLEWWMKTNLPTIDVKWRHD